MTYHSGSCRHVRPRAVLGNSPFRKAFAHIAVRGLVFDAAVFDHQLPDLAALADDFPDAAITLNHLGMAMGLGLDTEGRRELFVGWRERPADLAQRPNVYCKVGGLGLPIWGFAFEDRIDPIGFLELAEIWRPYVETGLELFGANRCLAESNFPPDGRSCGFVPLWNALKHIVAGASVQEKAALFSGTACRVLLIALPKTG